RIPARKLCRSVAPRVLPWVGVDSVAMARGYRAPLPGEKRRYRRPMRTSTEYTSAAISAVMGIVSTHAVTIRRVTPHDTAESRVVAPAPMIDAVMQCVVDTGSAM